jgi:hypothetical protein
MSNPTVVTASSRSAAVTGTCSAIAESKFDSAPCSTTTPLGAPVEPEV